MIRVAMQPNGLYCAFTIDGPKYNLTEEDYYDLALQEIKDNFKGKDYVEGINSIISKVSDDTILVEMGFDKPHTELVKYLPRKVIFQSYNQRDCETVGKCPACKSIVTNGIAGKDIECPNCHQILEW